MGDDCVPGGCGGCGDSECSRADILHVIPLDDLIVHTDDDECLCGPRTEAVFRADGSNGWLIVHNSLDGREASE